MSMSTRPEAAASVQDDDSTRSIVSPLVDLADEPAGEPEPDSPTRVLPVAEPLPANTPVTQSTVRAPSQAPPEERPDQSPPPAHRRVDSRRRRWPLVLGGVLVAVLGLAAAFFVVPVGDPAPRPPAYPAVTGELGEHLEQLQESVQP